MGSGRMKIKRYGQGMRRRIGRRQEIHGQRRGLKSLRVRATTRDNDAFNLQNRR